MTNPNPNIIPRSTAIDRMRDGLPCETNSGVGWIATDWTDFNEPLAQFRIPPEPRREAREWWINVHINCVYPTKNGHGDRIHVREVLPDEVVIEKMTCEEVKQKAMEIADCHHYSFYAASWVEFARALSLLRNEGDKC